MAEEQPSLHIDTDWKKQAQEEKRKLAEQEKAKAEEVKPTTAAPSPFAGSTAEAAPRGRSTGGRTGAPGARELPAASFAVLVQSIVTQVLFYLGDLAPRGSEPQMNLDMAKHQVDLLGVLEEKTKGNLSDEEKHFLDAALYETRMRYVSVSSQFVS
ncbi:MAG TPA: DUF1844 domain-containing protein [Tepidisphaeraceae bacterium]|jgi:hypothetical protein|nr:DUF1844 domain-containing protein [Tepidisphaeraceae bacterium]